MIELAYGSIIIRTVLVEEMIVLKKGKKLLGSLLAASFLVAASPAYAEGYELIYMDNGVIVGYERYCDGVIIESWGIVTGDYIWFYRGC